MTSTVDNRRRSSGQPPSIEGVTEEQIARWFAMLMEDIEIVGGEMGDAGERLLAKVFSEETIAELGEMIKAHRLPAASVKMLVDQDWLRRHVENDPDLDTEAGSSALLAAAKGEKRESADEEDRRIMSMSDDDLIAETYAHQPPRLDPPPSHPDRREQYARIVDDREAFRRLDMKLPLSPSDRMSLDEDIHSAYAKADQILALPVPGGWKMAPVEPTEEMILAGYAEKTGGRHATPSRIYRAMLAAAPPSAGGA